MCTKLGGVSLPEGLKKIEYSAFNGCTALKEVNMPKTITSVGDSAFRDCTALGSISMEYNSAEEYTASIDYAAFSGCTALKDVRLSENVSSIGDKAFSGCTALEELALPESITILGNQMIEGTSISSIVIPKNVSDKGYYFDGPLANCKTLKTVVLEEGMTKIPSSLCASSSYTSYIETVSIPSTVTTVGGYAFYNCGNLRYVNYAGTYEEWSSIIVNSDNTCLTSAEIHYHTHSYQVEKVVKPTCTEQGYTRYVCASCGKSYVTDYVDANGHTYMCKVTKRATCEEEGEKIYTCSVCKDQYTEKIPALQHDYSIKTETVPPTCQSEGEMMLYCTNCGGSKTVSIPMLDHNYELVVVAPTCTAMGYTLYTCTMCGDSYKTAYKAAIGHSFSTDWTVNEKQHYHNCKNCDFIKDVSAHTYTWVVDQAATTEKTGIKHEKCMVCGYKRNVGTVIDKLKEAHVHTYITVVTPAKLKQDGSIVKKCSGCGQVSKTEILYYPKKIRLSQNSYVYMGKECRPKVTVIDRVGKRINSSNYRVQYKNNKNIGIAKVTIVFRGNYRGTYTKKFTINPKKFFITTVKVKSKEFTAKWKKQGGQVTGYQLQYAPDKLFRKAKNVTVKGGSKTSVMVKRLQPKKTYYVRIRSYKTVKINGRSTKIYSDWSKAKMIKTKK